MQDFPEVTGFRVTDKLNSPTKSGSTMQRDESHRSSPSRTSTAEGPLLTPPRQSVFRFGTNGRTTPSGARFAYANPNASCQMQIGSSIVADVEKCRVSVVTASDVILLVT